MVNCNLRVQDGPEIKGEVTSPSWENREKFAASREKCYLTEDTPQKNGYIISSYEPLADLVFLYFNIRQNNNKTKINNNKKKKCCKNFFCKPLTCLILILFLFFKEPNQKSIKKESKKNYVFIKI